MAGKRYDTIICDLGNVLVNFDHRIAAGRILSRTTKGEEEIYALFFDSGLTMLYEEGRISSDEFFVRVRKALELDMDYKDFLPIWNDIFFETPLNIKMHALLRRVKPRYKLIMVSNPNKSHFEFLKGKMPVFGLFDRLVLSYEAGCRKPAPEIYKTALDSAKTIPSKALYIDDRKDLIEAAAGLGIRGVVFEGGGAFDRIVKEIDGDYDEVFNHRRL